MDGSGITPDVTMGPRTTATSAAEGRLKVDAGARKGKKAILKRKINNAVVK